MDLQTRLSGYFLADDESGLLDSVSTLKNLDLPVRGMCLLARAAREGFNDAVRVLLENGADPNCQLHECHPTPLSQAAVKGNLVALKLLLKYDADPNFYRPLISAINGGSLKTVQLLAEAGADINRLYDGSFTALGFAKQCGQTEIIAYLEGLRALGSAEAVKLYRASQPGFFERLAKRFGITDTKARTAVEISDFFEEKFCQSRPLDTKQIFGKKAGFQIHIIYPSARSPNVVLFTTGLSAQPLSVTSGDQKFSRAELYLELSPEWPSPQEEPSSSWPLAWMMNIGEQIQRTKESFHGPYAIIANQDPPQPFSDSTGFSCWLLEADLEIEIVKEARSEPIQVYRMWPLFSEERDLELSEGIDELRKSFAKGMVPSWIVSRRQNVGLS